MERRYLLHHVQPEKGEDNDSNLDPILWSGRLLLDQPRPEKFRMVRQASLAARDRASRARRCDEQVDKLKNISIYLHISIHISIYIHISIDHQPLSQVPRHAHVRHVGAAEDRHEGGWTPTGPRPAPRKGGKHICRPMVRPMYQIQFGICP